MISVHFQGKPFSITVIQVYAPTSNAEEAEVERYYEDLQDLLELTPKKDVLLGWAGWISLQSKGLSRVFSNTTVQKHQFFGAQLSSQSNSHIHI